MVFFILVFFFLLIYIAFLVDLIGHLREPKYSHLKQLHVAIKSMEKVLTKGDKSTTKFGDGVLVCLLG